MWKNFNQSIIISPMFLLGSVSCKSFWYIFKLPKLTWSWLIHIRWNGNIFILKTFSSLFALEVVKMTTSSAKSGEIFVKITTFPFQCFNEQCSSCWHTIWQPLPAQSVTDRGIIVGAPCGCCDNDILIISYKQSAFCVSLSWLVLMAISWIHSY